MANRQCKPDQGWCDHDSNKVFEQQHRARVVLKTSEQAKMGQIQCGCASNMTQRIAVVKVCCLRAPHDSTGNLNSEV